MDDGCFRFVFDVGADKEDFGLDGTTVEAATVFFFDAGFCAAGICLFDRCLCCCCCCCRDDGVITIRGGIGEGELFSVSTGFFAKGTILLYEKLSLMMALLFSCNFQWFISTDMIQNKGL